MNEVDRRVFLRLFNNGKIKTGGFDEIIADYKSDPEQDSTLKTWVETNKIDWERSWMRSGEESVFVSTHADDNRVDVIVGEVVSENGDKIGFGAYMRLLELARLMAETDIQMNMDMNESPAISR